MKNLSTLFRLGDCVKMIEECEKERTVLICEAFENGWNQKTIGSTCGLSASRVKEIIGEQKTKGIK